jgi:exodeoxyribonuclease VII small subunit
MSKPPDAPGKAETPAPVETLSFEAALAELERVVAALEQGEVPLEESIALYERGAALRARCQKVLEEAEAKIALITEGAEGRIEAKPVEIG